MTAYTLAFAASFFFVGLKSVQQLNVVHKQYWWILPTSMLMALCETWVIFAMVKNGFGAIVLATGTGAGLGAIVATYLHGRLLKGEQN